jgi:hypothetical protein
MILAFKIALALIGFGLGAGGGLYLASVEVRNVRRLALSLQIGVFALAVAVVIDASFGRIGPNSRGDPLFFWALWGGLIGVCVAGLVLLIRLFHRVRSKRE